MDTNEITAIATGLISLTSIMSWLASRSAAQAAKSSATAANTANEMAQKTQERIERLDNYINKVRLNIQAQNRKHYVKSSTGGAKGATYKNKEVKGFLIGNKGVLPVDILEIKAQDNSGKHSETLTSEMTTICPEEEQFFPLQNQSIKMFFNVSVTYECPNTGEKVTTKKLFGDFEDQKVYDDF